MARITAKQANPITTDSLFSMRLFNADRDLPIVYSPIYNISCGGVEMLHHFDTKKYAKIADHLSDEFLDTPYARVRHYDEPEDEPDEANAVRPRRLRYLAPNRPVNERELELHHSAAYLNRLRTDKALIARITEVWALNLVPMFAIESRLLRPLKLQVAGTIFAFHLAIQHGWSINLGGGFHQGAAEGGETFCLYSDICLAMKYVWRKHPFQRYMIIDLDAHQATGLERDLADLDAKRRKFIYLLDMFNNSIQPPDPKADTAIDQRVELARFTGDETYLKKLEEALETASQRFRPTLVIYVAGQDILKDDKLGLLNLSDEALKRRDEMVFSWACERTKCPIVMLLGGGYSSHGTRLQADSIRNLFAKGLIWGGHKSGSRSLSRPRRIKPPDVSSTSTGSSSTDRHAFKTMTAPPANPKEPAAAEAAAAAAEANLVVHAKAQQPAAAAAAVKTTRKAPPPRLTSKMSTVAAAAAAEGPPAKTTATTTTTTANKQLRTSAQLNLPLVTKLERTKKSTKGGAVGGGGGPSNKKNAT